MVSALEFHAEYRGFESRLGRDTFQTINMPSSYSTCPALSIIIIVRLSLLTMTKLNYMREMVLFVCSKMAN